MNQVAKTLKDSALARWSVLIFISLIMFAGYYVYDIFSSIKNTLQTELNLSNTDYGLWYGIYSFTNAFLGMALFGGIILDRWGIRRAGTIFLSFMFLGTLGIGYGTSDAFRDGGMGYGFLDSFMPGYSPELKLMIIGRLILGLGSETFWVIINKVIAKWFKGKELALAFGISLAFGRFGTAAALIFAPQIADVSGIDGAGWFGLTLVIMALMCFVLFSFFDFRYDKQIKKQTSDDHEEAEKLKFKDIIELLSNKTFWYIVLLCLTFYSAVFPFFAYAPDFLVNKFGFTEKASGIIMTALPFGTILFTPIFGYICDRFGKSASLMMLGSLLLIFVHLTFSYTYVPPIIPLLVLGIAFSLVPAAMWPSVANIIDSKKLGTAYGFMFTIQNWGLMFIPIFAGMILDGTNKNANDFYSSIQVKEIVETGGIINRSYVDNKNRAIVNKDFNAYTLILSDSTDNATVLLSEMHKVTSDSEGQYKLDVGKSNILEADIDNFTWDEDTFYYSVKYLGNREKVIVSSSVLNTVDEFENSFIFNEDVDVSFFTGKFKMEIEVRKDSIDGTIAWKEIHEIKKQDDGNYVFNLGQQSEILNVDMELFRWDTRNSIIKISTPLDYKLTMLMFSFLGVIGFVFAFLLKREDKIKNIGIELPNRGKE